MKTLERVTDDLVDRQGLAAKLLALAKWLAPGSALYRQLTPELVPYLFGRADPRPRIAQQRRHNRRRL